MCGVIGYIGINAIKTGIEMLKNLEYRGYDSAGVSFFVDNNISTIKSVGKIDSLKNKLPQDIEAKCIIAHSRWATHGKPCDENSHPHNSHNNIWSVVHNGIIENYEQLKKEINCKYLISETDTEIFAHLLENSEGNVEPMQTIIKNCEKIKGSFAFAILNKHNQDTLFLAKRESPLYVGYNGKECFVASDPIAFVGKIETYFCLNDNEFCVAKKDCLIFYNNKFEQITKEKINMQINKTDAELNGFNHFMLKEILETPKILTNIIDLYQSQNIFKKIKLNINNINKIKIIGCGTAYNSGLIGMCFLKECLKIETEVCLASEFRYSKPLIDNKTLCIFVSQSGETADTLGALNLAINKKCKTIAITNVLHSTLAQKVGNVLPIFAGPEIAVASTKAYTLQCLVFYIFSLYLKLSKHNKQFNYKKINKKIKNLAINMMDLINFCNKNTLNKVVEKINISKNVFFIGRSWDYFSCLEGSLKLKEISYINCLGIAGGELKHGTLALIEKGVLVIVLLTDNNIADKTLNAIEQIKTRGANVVLISNCLNSIKVLSPDDIFIKLNDFNEKWEYPLLSIIPLQLLAYYVSISKNINPDMPRNLAKSVTVE